MRPQSKKEPDSPSLSVDGRRLQGGGIRKSRSSSKRVPARKLRSSKQANGAWSPPKEWCVRPSRFAQNTVNPIRRMVDVMKLDPNPAKQLIKLSIGDPTVCGILNPAPETILAMERAVVSGEFNGYPNSIGYEKSRAAIAKYWSHQDAPLTAKDVILTSGCSHALELAITFLANEGDNIVIPRPGFPLYSTIAGTLGIKVKYYNLLPEEEWNVDLNSLEGAIDGRTRAIITNSPSNPCGAVFSKEHVTDIVAIAERYKVPIIADEVYENVTFRGKKHTPFAQVGKNIPVLSVGALSKRFLLPGWRLGWLAVHDQLGILEEARKDLVSLTQRILGPSSIVQGALPEILEKTPQSLFQYSCALYEKNANTAFEELSRCPGLTPVRSSGAMYMMVKIDLDRFDNVGTDIEFTEKLISEESVFCLPTQSFNYEGFFRIVLATSPDLLSEACQRIHAFCEKHYTDGLEEK